jgi:hypothetical protein
MRKILFSPVAIAAASLVFGACDTNTNTNANLNSNVNANTARLDPTPTPTPRTKLTEEEAKAERARAKENKETIGDTLEDAWIHAKIVTKLIGDSKTPERSINVDVVNNAVTLRGTVETVEAKIQAEEIAKGTEGVTKVTNQLKVVAAKPANSNKAAKTAPAKP